MHDTVCNSNSSLSSEPSRSSRSWLTLKSAGKLTFPWPFKLSPHLAQNLVKKLALSLGPQLRAAWQRTHPARQLRLRETLGLGEKRFLAIVEFEDRRFLVAATAGSVQLLTELSGGAAARESAGSSYRIPMARIVPEQGGAPEASPLWAQ